MNCLERRNEEGVMRRGFMLEGLDGCGYVKF
jgi:hypothetical protein